MGAIGVMAVKKTIDGIWLHFAHNTDSFALASMSSEDLEPSSVMSRIKTTSGSGCTSGGRSLHHAGFKRDGTFFKRQKQTRSDPEATSSSAYQSHPSLAVYSGTTHPDGTSIAWEPLPVLSGLPPGGTQGRPVEAGELNKGMMG